MSFLVNSEHVADLRLLDVRGDPMCGAFRLRFEIQFSLKPAKQAERIPIVCLSARVCVSGTGTDRHLLGSAYPCEGAPLLEVNTYAETRIVYMCIELDRRKLEAMESLRLGKGLKFFVDVSGIAITPQGASTPADSIYLDVKQGAWVEVLGQLKYADVVLMEIPVGPMEWPPALSNAIDHLHQAQTAANRGEWRSAVAATRDVMESIEHALGNESEKDQELEDYLRRAAGKSLPSRLTALRRAMKILSNSAKHANGEAATIEWSREDAVMAVGIAACLLRRSALGREPS